MNNLIPVTLGNIVGGGLFVATFYWFAFLRQPAAAPLCRPKVPKLNLPLINKSYQIYLHPLPVFGFYDEQLPCILMAG